MRNGQRKHEALREACRLSGARWAAWLRVGPGGWQWLMWVGLGEEQPRWATWLDREAGLQQWLAQAAREGLRTRSWTGEAGPQTSYLTAVGLLSEKEVLLVGSSQPVEAGVWRLVALLWEGEALKAAVPRPGDETSREDPLLPARWQAMWATVLDIVANLEMAVVLQRTVERVREILDARGAEIGLVDEQEGVVRIAASASPWRDYTGIRFPLGEGVAGWTAATGKPIRVADFNRWERRKSTAFEAPFRSVVSVPLQYRDKILGVLTAYDDRVAHFTVEDERFLQMLAALVAVMLRNARLYEDLRRAKEVVEASRQQLVQSAKLATMGRLMAMIAHEVNSPLQAVLTSLHLAQRRDLSLQDREVYLRLAQQEVHRLRETVQRMLAYYRPEGTERGPVALPEVVAEVLRLVERQCARQNVEVRREVPANLPRVLGHFGQLRQVLLNLVVNALEAMPSGGVLTLKGWAEEGWVMLEVWDTGPGVPPEVQPRLFEPFVSTKDNGVGLGLAVSYNIMLAHQGTLTYCATPEQPGACFRLTLPQLVTATVVKEAER